MTIKFSFDDKGNSYLDVIDGNNDEMVSIPTANLNSDVLHSLAVAIALNDTYAVIRIWESM